MERIRLSERIKGFSSFVIYKFESFRWINWSIYCAILFAVGAVINIKTQFKFPHFGEHQFLLIAATTLLMCAIKSFFLDIRSLGNNSPDRLLSRVTEVKSIYNNRLLPLQKNPRIFVISVLIMVFFFTCIILVEYIEIDVIGIYAIYIAGSSIIIGAYGYIQYIIFLWFIYQIGNCEFNHYAYNVYVPSETAWLTKIAKMSQNLRNYFLCVGLLYTIEYSILIPTDKIELSDQGILLRTPNNIAFVASWIAFFLLVIIAFPVINYIQHALIVRVVNRLKVQTINELSGLMFEDLNAVQDRRSRMYSAISYTTLIENVRQTKEYPIKRQLSYETLMTIITFVVHIMNLLTKIASIPQLSASLS